MFGLDGRTGVILEFRNEKKKRKKHNEHQNKSTCKVWRGPMLLPKKEQLCMLLARCIQSLIIKLAFWKCTQLCEIRPIT